MNLTEKIRPELVWSAFLALMAGLLLRLMHIQLTALLLKSYAIGFNHQFFRITYQNAGGGMWNEGRVFVVYIAGTLVFLFFGILLFLLLRKVPVRNVKLRLFLTWLSFFSVFLLPLQMLASLVVHDEIGLGLSWFLPGRMPVLVVVFFLLLSGFALRPFWLRMFIRTAPDVKLINHFDKRRRFIMVIFLQAMLAGAVAMAVYAIAAGSPTWLLVIAFQTLMVAGLALPKLPEKTPRIRRSSNYFNLSPFTLIVLIVASLAPLVLTLF